MLGQSTILNLGAVVKEDLKAELRAQGHYLTGALENSIDYAESLITGGVALDISANDYLNPVNSGVPAGNIPYDPSNRTGAGTSKYIAGLQAYAKLRFRLDDKAALAAAFAIAAKHKKEGMPTDGSYQYSSTGKRTEVLEDTLNAGEVKYSEQLEAGISGELDMMLGMDEEVSI